MIIIKNEVRFISLLSDTTFKYLFRCEDTKPFIKKVLEEFLELDLSSFHMINGEYTSGSKRKDIRQDILLSNNPSDPKRGTIINVEMYSRFTKENRLKSNHYINVILCSLENTGESYLENNVIQINFYNSKYHKNCIEYVPRDKTGIEENKMFKIVDVYLENDKKSMYNKSNIRDVFRAFLRAESYEEMVRIANGRGEMMAVVKELKKLAVSDEFIGAYDAEKEFRKQMNTERLAGEREGLSRGLSQGFTRGRAEGLSQGLTRGRTEGMTTAAKNMLELGMDASTIHKVTNIPVNEIRQIMF